MFRIPAFTGWGYSKDFPRFAARTFRARWDGDTHVDKYTKQVEKDTSGQVDRDISKQVDNAASGQVSGDVVARFTEELKAVNGQLTRTNADDLTKKVIDILNSKNIKQIHVEPNLLDESVLQKAGITASHAPDPAIRVGVTKVICGLADTGSILEADGEGRSLHASLLPEIHIALLRESEILPSLDQGVHLMRASKSAVFITGPSRTGDIEMSQTIGVHGPGEVHVFLVDD